MKKKFNWREKTFLYPGRFQPFHKGHEKILESLFKKKYQVAILVMDSYKFNKKNPLTFNEVTFRINKSLKKYKEQYIIIKVPIIHTIVYGRKVGYKFKKIKLSKNLEKISATSIRKKLKLT